eukprot:471400-Hanusia_phi.AAC.3
MVTDNSTVLVKFEASRLKLRPKFHVDDKLTIRVIQDGLTEVLAETRSKREDLMVERIRNVMHTGVRCSYFFREPFYHEGCNRYNFIMLNGLLQLQKEKIVESLLTCMRAMMFGSTSATSGQNSFISWG